MSKFASLTAGLLARKGEAEPTSTPFAEQLLTRVGAPAADIRALTPMQPQQVHLHSEGGVEKQQGFKPVVAPHAPSDGVPSIFGAFAKRSAMEAVRQESDAFKPTLVPAVVEESTDGCASCTGPSAEELAKTYHVNLRLKRLRFVKLKLSSALLRRPVQEIVSEALDDWFEKLPPDVLGDCACMRARD